MAPTKESDTNSTQENDDGGNFSLAQNRSRRQKVDKTGRSSAFEKLRKAKEGGLKNKYEIEEEKNVYEIVDEGEYSELVRQRQDDDWIVDDDGAGYVEDGREIFDDDMDADAPSSVDSRKKREERKKNKNIVRPGTKPKQDIKTMFAAAASTSSTKRKSEREATLADDDVLEGLLGKIADSSSGPKDSSLVSSAKKSKKPYNPFNAQVKKSSSVFSAPSPPPAKKTPAPAPKPIKRELSYTHKSSRSASKQTISNSVVKSEPVAREQTCLDGVSAELETDYQDGGDADMEVDIKTELEDADCLSGIDFEGMDDDDVGGGDGAADVKVEPYKQVSEESLSIGWENVGTGASNDNSETTEVKLDSSQLPLVQNLAGEQILRFFWLDAFEDAYHQPGTIYLFGKVYVEEAKTYASCCVTVKNIERRIFILPRVKRVNLKTGAETDEDVTMPDVYEEFDRLADKHRILKFKSMKVKKSYAFEKQEVPIEAHYLEVRYGADMPSLPSDLKGETFSHVFGTNTSSLELLLVGRKMKGPAWLDLKCPQIPNPSVSWCKLEALISKPEHISLSEAILPPPPLVLMTLNLRTLPNPKTRQNEIVACSCLVHTQFHMDKPAPKKQLFEQHFCVITTPKDCIFPYDFREQVKKQSHRMKVDVMPTERGLIGFLLARIHRIDPDLLVGHDIYGFDLDLLLHRISANKIPHWSKMSRLKRSEMPRIKHSHGRATFAEQSAICGRILCDVQVSARELIRCRSYDLTELTNQILKSKRTEVDYDQVRESFLKTKDLLQLIEMTLMDSNYTLRIMYELNVLPLALQITNICGNVMSRTLMGGRSERNEWLLLHAFQEKQYLCPDKDFKKKQAVVVEEDEDNDGIVAKAATQGKRKPAYTGGLVLEPKKGFYDTYILLLDFNSLYPSIIQEYNICFTTISRSSSSTANAADDDEGDLILPDPDLEPGVLPTEIRKLVESRKQVKTLMKGSDVSHDQMMQYDIRQKALKLTANSMYGCLGFSFSRFYARPLAALVTGKGREILLKTKDLVQNMGLDVIYGDTDSIMINSNSTDLDTVYKMGNKVKAEVNKLYRLLEIDIDGVFKSMLLLKKKKYAALSISKDGAGKMQEIQEMKGLDIVRRDWCDLAKEAGKYVLSQILSGQQREVIVDNIHNQLQAVAQEVNDGKVDVELFYITKNLTKNPEDYPDKKSLAHVQVALRFNSKGGRKMKAGDTVPYIICEDGSTLSATQRAYHPEELSKQDNLKIDCKYYLAHQIHPVVARLCDPIEGTDSARIAECLGLDPTGYRQVARQEEKEEEDLVTLQLTMEERFQDCDRITFSCPSSKCGRLIVLDSAFTGKDSNLAPALQSCPNPECREPLWAMKDKLKNLIQLKIHKFVNKYYQGWLKCEDVECGARTDRVPLVVQRGHPVCHTCERGILRPEYTDSALYTQICFFEYVFDFPKACSYLNDGEKGIVRKVNPDVVETYRQLRQVSKRWLDNSAYSNVDLGKLFVGLGLARMQPSTAIKVEQ